MIPVIFHNKHAVFPAGMIIPCFILMSIYISGAANAESIFLKDGSIIDGVVVRDAEKNITIKLKDGRMSVIERKKIKRILYTQLYMGKVYIQRFDGVGIEAYMVDEDQTTYTFRKDLYSPEEFTLKRSDVLFIALKNPSGLSGSAGHDFISLKWFAPYNQVKFYNIYLKEKGGKDFINVIRTSDTGHTIKNLKSNKIYKIFVTAVDKNGYESLPSNEINQETKNIQPERVPGISLVKERAANKSYDAVISWREARDPDGRISEYRLYEQTEKGYIRLGNTTALSYKIREIPEKSIREFIVRSVDNNGDESSDSRTVSTRESFLIDIGVRPLFIKPLGSYGNLFNSGYGSFLGIYMSDAIFKGLSAGIEFGFFYMNGRHKRIGLSYLIPAVLSCSYRYNIRKPLFLEGRISAGYCYNSIKYNALVERTFGESFEEKSSKEHDAISSIELGLSLLLKNTFLGIHTGLGILYQKSGVSGFITAGISAGTRIEI